MNIKPIKTEDDYDEALKETEKLMFAQKDTPKGDMLDRPTAPVSTALKNE